MKNRRQMQPRQLTNNGYFSFTPIVANLIIIAVLIGVYYYITLNNFFPEWIDMIYWGLKIIIAFNIIIASGRSLLAPILALAASLLLLFGSTVYGINLVTSADTWQLLIVSLIGFVICIMVKFRN